MGFSLTTIRRAVLIAAVAWAGASAPAAEKADPVLHQARESLAKGDLDAAIARLDVAVRLDPTQAKCRGLRGVAWLRKGDYAKGAADLKAAIALNSGDAGLHYQPSNGSTLSARAVAHGQQQVAKMLHDRPAMADFGDEAKFLRDWAQRKFAGEDFVEPIDWDPSPPLHSDAEHLAPGGGENAAILVEAHYTSGPKEGKPRSFEELWAGAIYELHNVNYAREFVRLNDEADRGKVSKEAFVAGILKYELQAAQRTRAFYLNVFLPWAEKKKLTTDPTLWFCDWWDTPDSVLKSFSDKSAYPWRPYARVHDWATVHRFWRRAKFAKAQKLLEQMLDEEGYDEELSDVSYWLGRCLTQMHKPTEAVEALSEAIRLDPENAPAYRARGELYKKLGEKTKAEDDLAKAKKLESEE
jgi:tetratricopeptide (TPR) repeat protein